MCGIVGYIGNKNANEIVYQGIKRLEYRGYDSVGICYKKGNTLVVKKDIGKIEEVASKLNFLEEDSNLAIAHTRWGTHGKITKENAHPHLDCSKNIAIVHNGIIENFYELKEDLIKRGHKFNSETDSEVIAHLIEEYMKFYDFENSCKKAFSKLKGSFAVLAINSKEEKIVGIRKDSPLVIGVKENESFAASDIYALLPYTNEFIFLKNFDFVVLEKNLVKIENLIEGSVNRPIERIDFSLEQNSTEGFHHFMIKEIMEQGEIPFRVLEKNGEKFKEYANKIKEAKKVLLVGAGSSFHACIYGYYLFSKLGIDCKPIVASEFKNFSNILDENTILIAVSQSGETADVLEAVRIAKSKNCKVYSIVNVYGSTLMRESDFYLLMNSGFEVGVAATKTFTSQLIIFYILYKILKNESFSMKHLSSQILDLLGRSRREYIEKIADMLKDKEHIFLIGRGLSYVSSLEGALKIKEISYIHAEAFAGGELKHGTLALIENNTPCIVFVDRENYEEIISNAHEVKARGGFIIGVSPFKDKVFDVWIKIPDCEEEIPILQIIPIQLLAYLLSVKRGYNPDYPRNLAKSVTVK